MEEAILNSLLRYQNKTTPVRETYPAPSGAWSGNLRKQAAPINLSTYYLLDQPGLSNSPSKAARLTTCVSTTRASPKKLPQGRSAKKSLHLQSTEPSRRITEPEQDIKKAVEKEMSERKKITRSKTFESEQSVSQDFDEYKKSQESVVLELKEEIAQLKEQIYRSGGSRDESC